MKKNDAKKLRLSGETLRILTSSDLQKAAGNVGCSCSTSLLTWLTCLVSDSCEDPTS